MQELITATFQEGKLPEDWRLGSPSTLDYSFERGCLRSGRGTTIFIPLPGHAWHTIRVEMDIEPIQGATLEVGDGMYSKIVVALAGKRYPRHKVYKNGLHLLGESLKPVPEKQGIRSVVMEFHDGLMRSWVDGEEIISASDPYPRPFTGWIQLGFWDDCLVHRVRIFGEAPYPAPLFSIPSNKNSDFSLEVTVDFWDDLCRAPFTKSMFHDLFAEFKSWGVQRVHWIHYTMESEHLLDNSHGGAGKNVKQTAANVGEIFPAAVKAAHAQDVQIYGLIKPFDMGGFSYGEGTPEAKMNGQVQRIGGPMGVMAKFAAKYPEFLIARKPGAYGPSENEVFTRIDLVKEDDQPCAFTVNDIALYVSDDNAVYRPYSGPVRRREVMEDYPVYVHTASGGKRTERTCRSRVMRLDNLNIPNKYMVLTVPSGGASFTHTLINLVHVFGEKGEERRLTYGNQSRPCYNPTNPPHIPTSGFQAYGIVFDRHPGTPTVSFPGFDVIRDPFTIDQSEGILAIARGKDRSPASFLSPSFPDSRQWWLAWARDILEAGADGVEFRMRHHHSNFAWGEYGFEAPVTEGFKKRYGVDLLTTDDFDRAAFRRLRGEGYTQLYREAKQLCRSYGKSLGLHMSGMTMDMEPEQGAATEIHWDWRTWLKEGLPATVTMKEVYPRTHYAQEILSYTRPRGIPVVFSPFNSIWSGPRNLQLVEERIGMARENGYDGFQFYECAAVVAGTPDGRIVMQQPALRELFQKHFCR